MLVCFKQPPTRKGGKMKRRRPDSATPTTFGLMRRCVPYSHVERVVDHCHAGDLGRSLHRGQVATANKLSSSFDGIKRKLVRKYVKRCKVCSQQQVRQHKAALVPITAKRLFERIVIDLIGFSHKPSHCYKYNLTLWTTTANSTGRGRSRRRKCASWPSLWRRYWAASVPYSTCYRIMARSSKAAR